MMTNKFLTKVAASILALVFPGYSGDIPVCLQ